MRIVVDTNVFISGVFFGGYPRKVLESIIHRSVLGYATQEIVDEYNEIILEMIVRKSGKLSPDIMQTFVEHLELIEAQTEIHICRDPEDDKFIGCALDSGAMYIVSGDKDLLSLQKYNHVTIVTAKEFCDCYLRE